MLNLIIAETKDFSKKAIEALEQFACVDLKDIEFHEVAEALNKYDVFWFRLGFKLTSDIILQAARCKFIVCPVTGLDHIDLKACQLKGITVISLKGEIDFLKKVRATAELTIALTLALFRNIPQAVQSTHEGKWNREPFKGIEIFEKKIGILGFGRLGQITASYFSAMGATIYVYDIKPIHSETYNVVKSMDELFLNCDMVSAHVNLTTENKYLIGRAQFDLMKKGSYFINTSRGQLVNSIDLIKAIEEGQLAGAAVDVIENEFDFRNDELLKFSSKDQRLLITPHIGGNTFESFSKTELYMVEKLKSMLI
jgi:D-3-phosphoglycerate dehydrogenase / 2-oxoglutarate reductase